MRISRKEKTRRAREKQHKQSVKSVRLMIGVGVYSGTTIEVPVKRVFRQGANKEPSSADTADVEATS